MNVIGYLIEDEYYCSDCARDYCLDSLCLVLSNSEMIKLIPTNKLTTDFIVELKKDNNQTDLISDIIAIVDFNMETSDMNSFSSFDFCEASSMECSNFHELNFPHKLYPLLAR